jgi:arsenate reductase
MHYPIEVLFLCTGNSARSQMAEGLLRSLGKEHFEVYSAGTYPKELNPLAVAVMQELRIDISGQRSKDLTEFLGREFDYIITVCDRARDNCPTFPGDNQRIHWSFEDPAAAVGDESHKLEVFRRIRNEIRTRITIWLPAMMKLLKDKGITT